MSPITASSAAPSPSIVLGLFKALMQSRAPQLSGRDFSQVMGQ